MKNLNAYIISILNGKSCIYLRQSLKGVCHVYAPPPLLFDLLIQWGIGTKREAVGDRPSLTGSEVEAVPWRNHGVGLVGECGYQRAGWGISPLPLPNETHQNGIDCNDTGQELELSRRIHLHAGTTGTVALPPRREAVPNDLRNFSGDTGGGMNSPSNQEGRHGTLNYNLIPSNQRTPRCRQISQSVRSAPGQLKGEGYEY